MSTDLSMLNEEQKNAILESINNNVILLASAGSGKTFTLTKRVEYLINECNVDASNIMLITFTNKAANEILNRVSKVTPDVYRMWIGTFHGICVKLLRKFGPLMGIKNFSILTQSEQFKLIKDIYKTVHVFGYPEGVDIDNATIKKARKLISHYKSNLQNPAYVLEQCSKGFENYRFAGVYQEYQNRCWKNKTFDFDDLIIYTILLISSYPEVKDWLSNNIKYIMADECQDTSTDQYVLIRLLTNDNNIMMVGDFSQSIYGFRNAKPENINKFVKDFPNTKSLKLSINYRSTNTIIEAANAVINNNISGEKVNMKSVNELGDKIGIKSFSGVYSNNPQLDEANWICSEIGMLVTCGGKQWKDFAIINRTNLQNKEIEKVLIKSSIPYSVVGASSFWTSASMRDILAYCKVCFNPYDKASFTRVLGLAKGVGKTTIDKILQHMIDYELNCHEVISDIFINHPHVFMRTSKVALQELDILDKIINNLNNSCSDIARYIINNSSYTEELRSNYNDESIEKMETLQDIIKTLEEFEEKGDSPESVIDQVSLMTDAKGEEKSNLNSVKVMTAHACKGLEFDTVFIGGVEEGLFPHANSIKKANSNKELKESIEEERRLFYVAMTRAKKKLYITYCLNRNNNSVKPSRFLKEVPEYLTELCF